MYHILTSNALVQDANCVLEGVALLKKVQVVCSLLGKPVYGELHSALLSFM